MYVPELPDLLMDPNAQVGGGHPGSGTVRCERRPCGRHGGVAGAGPARVSAGTRRGAPCGRRGCPAGYGTQGRAAASATGDGAERGSATGHGARSGVGGRPAGGAAGRQAKPVGSTTGRPGPRTGRPRPALRADAVASAARPARRNGPERGLPPSRRLAGCGWIPYPSRAVRQRPEGSAGRPPELRGGHGSGPGRPRGTRRAGDAVRPAALCRSNPAAAGGMRGATPRRGARSARAVPRRSATHGRGRAGARLGAQRAAGPAAHRGRARGRVARLRLRPSPASTRPRPPRSSRRPRTPRRPPRQPSPQRKA